MDVNKKNPLKNLRALKQDMEKNGWIVDSFRFTFKKIDYIVLVILFQPGEPRKQYALLQLDFLRADNFDVHFLTEANTAGLMAEAKDLRKFFGIEYSSNLGCILQQFAERLGEFIPTAVKGNKPPIERQAMVHALSKNDSEDPRRIYCFAVKRNPIIKDSLTGTTKQQKRSAYNDRKTHRVRPALYNRLGKDPTISFCYSDDPSKDYSDEEIIDSWITRKQRETRSR